MKLFVLRLCAFSPFLYLSNIFGNIEYGFLIASSLSRSLLVKSFAMSCLRVSLGKEKDLLISLPFFLWPAFRVVLLLVPMLMLLARMLYKSMCFLLIEVEHETMSCDFLSSLMVSKRDVAQHKHTFFSSNAIAFVLAMEIS